MLTTKAIQDIYNRQIIDAHQYKWLIKDYLHDVLLTNILYFYSDYSIVNNVNFTCDIFKIMYDLIFLKKLSALQQCTQQAFHETEEPFHCSVDEGLIYITINCIFSLRFIHIQQCF